MKELNHQGGFEVLNHLPGKQQQKQVLETLKKTEKKLADINEKVDEWLSIFNDALFH